MNKLIALCALFSMLCVSGSVTASSSAAAARVQVDGGILQGAVEGNVASFKGVPYAAPPIGNLRWVAPQPVPAWAGARDATHFGHDCMQIPDPMEAAPQGTTTPSEDCLFLNLWTPANHASKKLAVIIWVHGGGFVNGGSSTPIYDGSAFARQGVVFVSFNFRLGRFGFFAHPALTAEHPDGLLGNYTYLDQIALLQWVHRNIAAFGGDPSNVTIMGESAGGGSVHFLANCPMARGLFQKGIVESGGGREGSRPRRLSEDIPGVPSGETLGLAFAAKHGIVGSSAQALAALRALPALDVVDNLNIVNRRADASVGATFPGPMVDGKLITKAGESAHMSSTQVKMPMIIGGNDSDLAYPQGSTIADFLKPFGANTDKARAIYDPHNTGDVKEVGDKIARDRGQLEPARYITRLLTSQGHVVYEFRYSYVADSMRSEWSGAPHASEVPFVFNNLHARYGDKTTPADEAMARTISGYWIAFAKTGNPNGGDRPNWPTYDAKQDILANFTDKGVVIEPDPWKERLDLTEESHHSDK